MYKEGTYYAKHRARELEKAKTYRNQPGKKEERRVYTLAWRKSHPNYLKDWRKRHWGYFRDHQRELRREVLIYYGGGKLACVRCGFSNIKALSIDHIDGNGLQHKNALLKEFGYSKNMSQWLKKQGFPKGYQTLCMNCQFLKRA